MFARQQSAIWRSFSAIWLPPWMGYALIFLIALGLRTYQLGSFVTTDESMFWMHRSALWRDAIFSHQWADTAIAPHPGVTTMWLGAIGLQLFEWLAHARMITPQPFTTQLAFMQLPVAWFHSAGVLIGYHLLRRMYGGWVALLAALLWAADPFTVGYSRLLHVDGLAGTGLIVSVLAACAYWYHGLPRHWLLISAVAASVAVLSKTTGLVIAPLILCIVLSVFSNRPGWWRDLVIWCAGAILMTLILWPATWAAPLRVFALLQVGVEAEGSQPHALGNFFLGREDLAPGWLFYPVALVLRSTPWELLGIFGLFVGFRQLRPDQRRTTAVLILAILLVVIGLSPFPKKFNRYLVPAFPFVSIVSTLGLATSAGLLVRWLGHAKPTITKLVRLSAGILCAAALGVAAAAQPYALAYFNPLLGGASAGRQTFLIGWGEGLEQVAAWLNDQPNSTGVLIASTQTETLQPYLNRGIQAIDPSMQANFPEQTGYAVIYIRDAQVRPLPPFEQIYREQQPVHTVIIDGVPYAWIYQIAPSVPELQAATFANGLDLRGFDLQSDDPLTTQLTLYWQADMPPTSEIRLFVHILDANGQRIAQEDIPLPMQEWQPGMFPTTVVPIPGVDRDEIHADRIMIGLYNPKTMQRIQVTTQPTYKVVGGYEDAVLLVPLPRS